MKGCTMPSTKKYQVLQEQLLARPGAEELQAEAMKDTLAEIGLYELRKRRKRSLADLASVLGISRDDVSQLEDAGHMTVSRLERYLARLGGRLKLLAVFDDEEYSIPIRVRARRG